MNNYEPEINPLLTSSASDKLFLNIPERASNALTGSQFSKKIYNIPPDASRDKIIINEILSGNIPNFMRNFQPITLIDKGNTIQYYAAPDYLCVGSDDDYLRIVLGGKSAKYVCDNLNCSLPTKKMVDDIWKLADLKLEPKPMGGSSAMVYSPKLIEHNDVIQKQIGNKSFKLLAGIKKDIIIGKPLLTFKNNIGIYGWQYLNGSVIQNPPNYTSHNINYCDYSQAIRLCSKNALLNDQSVDLMDILSNPQFAYLISEEGAYNASSIYV